MGRLVSLSDCGKGQKSGWRELGAETGGQGVLSQVICGNLWGLLGEGQVKSPLTSLSVLCGSRVHLHDCPLGLLPKGLRLPSLAMPMPMPIPALGLTYSSALCSLGVKLRDA